MGLELFAGTNCEDLYRLFAIGFDLFEGRLLQTILTITLVALRLWSEFKIIIFLCSK